MVLRQEDRAGAGVPPEMPAAGLGALPGAWGPRGECPISPRHPTGPLTPSSSSPAQVPDALFSTLLAYLEGLRGRARELTVQKAEALMQEVDKASGAEPLPLGKTQRIRRVLQLLS